MKSLFVSYARTTVTQTQGVLNDGCMENVKDIVCVKLSACYVIYDFM